MLHLESFGSSDSAIAGVILQMGLMPAAIVMPNLSNRLKATEQDIILKRTISTFQTIIREKEDEIFLLEQKLSFYENSATAIGSRQSDGDQQIAKARLAASITKLVSTLYTSKDGSNKGPRKEDLIETLDKMRVCLRTIQGISDEDWQAVLEPVGDTLLNLQTEQLRRGSISSMLDRISISQNQSQTNLYSNAQYMELERSINAVAALEESDDNTLNGEAEPEAEAVSDRPDAKHRQELFERAFAKGSVPLTDSELKVLAESMDDELLHRFVALHTTKWPDGQRLHASLTPIDSGSASPLANQTTDSAAKQARAIGNGCESETNQPIANELPHEDALSLSVARSVATAAQPAITRNVDLVAQVQTLLDARSQQSVRIRELETLLETYRVTATQLNRNLSRDITALSYISDDSRSFLRPNNYKQQPGVDRDVRGSTASLQLDLSRSDSVNFSAVDTEGEVRTYDKFDVHINVQLDAGRVEAQVRLIECARVIEELNSKIATYTREVEHAERRVAELALKDREIEQLRSKLQDAVQSEATLKKQIGVLTDTIAAIRDQKGSAALMHEQFQALAKAEVSGKLELVDLNAERHRLYEASRADGATIHKLQLTARELDLTNRKLKSQLESFQSSHNGLLREISALKDTIEDLSIQLDEVRLQCASWQRKASNYRRIAANIMSKLGSYKQQIRGLVLARLHSTQSASNFDVHLSRSSLAILDEDEAETFHIIESLES